MKKLTILYTTVSNQPEAEKLATLVLTEKLAACVNIITSGQSIYLWKGKVNNNPECYILFKTLPENTESLKKLILNHHPYETPALLQWEAGTSDAFFDYLNDEMKS